MWKQRSQRRIKEGGLNGSNQGLVSFRYLLLSTDLSFIRPRIHRLNHHEWEYFRDSRSTSICTETSYIYIGCRVILLRGCLRDVSEYVLLRSKSSCWRSPRAERSLINVPQLPSCGVVKLIECNKQIGGRPTNKPFEHS